MESLIIFLFVVVELVDLDSESHVPLVIRLNSDITVTLGWIGNNYWFDILLDIPEFSGFLVLYRNLIVFQRVSYVFESDGLLSNGLFGYVPDVK